MTDQKTGGQAQRELPFRENGTPSHEENGTSPHKEAASDEEDSSRVGQAGPSQQHPPEGSTEPTSSSEEPYVLAVEASPEGGPARHVRHFAVALHELIRPRSEREHEQALRAADAWHRDLLGLLSRWPSGEIGRAHV